MVRVGNEALCLGRSEVEKSKSQGSKCENEFSFFAAIEPFLRRAGREGGEGGGRVLLLGRMWVSLPGWSCLGGMCSGI